MKNTVKHAATRGLEMTAGALTAIPAVYALMLRPRRKGADWGTLRQYRYAHRGLHDLSRGIPENSLPAFRRAVEHGFGAELDVHLLADGTLAVFHDSALRRMTGADGDVEDLTAAQLGEYRLGGTEETIPVFSRVLEIFEGTGLPLVVELKSHDNNFAALCEAAMAELDRFHVPCCVESFDPRCIVWLRRHRPDVVRGQLSQDFLREPSGMRRGMDAALTGLVFNAGARPDFIAYRFEDRRDLSLRLCRALYGVQVFYWTIRTRADMEEAERSGAQVIFENFIP